MAASRGSVAAMVPQLGQATEVQRTARIVLGQAVAGVMV